MRPCTRLFACAALTAIVGGCAMPSPYHARDVGVGGGYDEVQIDRETFRVTYAGTVGTSQAEADERALLRSAEVALDHGFPFFVTAGFAATGTAMSLATNTVSVPATTLTIRCFVERPVTTAVVHDAVSVVSTVGPKYRAS